MISEARAHGLQAMYLAGAIGALAALREECTSISCRIINAKVRKMHLPVSRERIEEIASDSASMLIARFLSDPGFHVRRFGKMLGYRINDELFISPRQKQRTFEARIQFKDFLSDTACESGADPVDDAALDLATSHPWGKKAVADLCRSRSYRQAIKRIATYVERRWIYDHATGLHQVYRALHTKTGPRGSVSRSGLSAVRKELLRRQQTEHKLSSE